MSGCRYQTRGRGKFKFKVHSVTKENLGMWDLALFATPRHPGFNKLKSGETKYLRLDFATTAERQEFVVSFNKLIKIYAIELETIEIKRAKGVYESDHPKRASSQSGSHPLRSPSIVFTKSSSTVRSPSSPAPRQPDLTLNPNVSNLSLSLYGDRVRSPE